MRGATLVRIFNVVAILVELVLIYAIWAYIPFGVLKVGSLAFVAAGTGQLCWLLYKNRKL